MANTFEQSIVEFAKQATVYQKALPELIKELANAATIDKELLEKIKTLTEKVQDSSAKFGEFLNNPGVDTIERSLAKRLETLRENFQKIELSRKKLVQDLKDHPDFIGKQDEEDDDESISLGSSVERKGRDRNRGRNRSYRLLSRQISSPSLLPYRGLIIATLINLAFCFWLYNVLDTQFENNADEQTRSDSDEDKERAENNARIAADWVTFFVGAGLEGVAICVACCFFNNNRQQNVQRDLENVAEHIVLQEESDSESEYRH